MTASLSYTNVLLEMITTAFPSRYTTITQYLGYVEFVKMHYKAEVELRV